MFATTCSTANCPNPPRHPQQALCEECWGARALEHARQDGALDLLTARIRESYGLEDPPKGPKAPDLASLSAEAAIKLYGRTDRLGHLMPATRHDDPKMLAEIAESLRQSFKRPVPPPAGTPDWADFFRQTVTLDPDEIPGDPSPLEAYLNQDNQRQGHRISPEHTAAEISDIVAENGRPVAVPWSDSEYVSEQTQRDVLAYELAMAKARKEGNLKRMRQWASAQQRPEGCPDAFWEAYLLVDAQGLSYREAASLLGVSHTEVANRAAKVRAHLPEMTLQALRPATGGGSNPNGDSNNCANRDQTGAPARRYPRPSRRPRRDGEVTGMRRMDRPR